ncbi:MAG: aldolase/citrate lyase family protein [Phycisphaeraceae bacterium]
MANGSRPIPGDDPFFDRRGRPRVLRGVACYSGSTRLAELAARIGFEVVWIEMEHGPTDFERVEQLCCAVEAAGAVPAVRVAAGTREHVLKALEVGARMVVVPMVNSAAEARELVEWGKFPPLGQRGYNLRSRGVGYGLAPVPELFARANARTHLIPQIETLEAVDDLDAILEVEGISGILVGPGDLSSQLGCPGCMDDPRLVELATSCIRRARAAQRHAGILISRGPLLDQALAAGCDFAVAGGDVADLCGAWQSLLEALPTGPAPLSR